MNFQRIKKVATFTAAT